MKNCKNCGAKIEDDAKFCPTCGANQDEAQPAAPVDPYDDSPAPAATETVATETANGNKKCEFCGLEVPASTQVCPKCGFRFDGKQTHPGVSNKSPLLLAAGIFMIIACIAVFGSLARYLMEASAIVAKGTLEGSNYENMIQTFESAGYSAAQMVDMVSTMLRTIAVISLIPLAWQIPMTVHVFKARARGTAIGTAFKVCTLLFVSLISGILLLVDKTGQQN